MVVMPVPPNWRDFPKTAEEWKKQVDAGVAAAVQTLPALREQLHVKTEATTIDGVPTFIVTPDAIRPRIEIAFSFTFTEAVTCSSPASRAPSKLYSWRGSGTSR
jgi:hypothetical protein